MEGPLEKQWRRDATWAIVVIVAAILLVLDAAGRVSDAIRQFDAQPGPRDEFDVALLESLAPYAVLLFCVGGLLFFLYAVAAFRNVRIFPRACKVQATWNLWHVARTAAAAYLGGFLVVVGAAAAATLLLGKEPGAEYLLVANGYLVHLGLLVLSVGFAVATGGGARALGLTFRGGVANVVHGVLGYVATLPAFYI